ncbi:MAG: hypothetical protein WCS06_10405 [Dysgonamonadaceae bacterium]|jgi:hypothetical protein
MKTNKKECFITFLTVMGLIIVTIMNSCTNEKIDDLTQNKETADQTVNFLSHLINVEDGMLSFENESELKSIILEMKNNEKNKTRMGSIELYLQTSDLATDIKGFKSLYDTYEEALDVAVSYYEREGGYEEFKKRFSSLYFPEHKDDYAVYLPVTDETLAKLLNVDGYVIIGDKKINMKDISTYEQLEKLGRTFPDVDQTEENTLNVDNLQSNEKWVRQGEVIYNSAGNRRFELNWDKVVLQMDNQWIVNMEIRMSFRAKNFLGIWYNYSSSGILGFGSRDINAPVPADGDPNFAFRKGFSPLTFNPTAKFNLYPVSLIQSARFESVGIWVSFDIFSN